MIFIHHYHDSETEKKPPAEVPEAIRQTINRLRQSVALNPPERLFVSSHSPSPSRVMVSPKNMGSDYWEIVVEDTDL